MSGNRMWSDAEIAALRAIWPVPGSMKSVVAPAVPTRSLSGIATKAVELGLGPRPASPRERYSPAWDAIARLLAERPNLSAWQIARLAGVPRDTVIGHVRAKHRIGAIHISGHVREGVTGKWERCWTLGEGRDKKAPRALTSAEKFAREWKRLKADDDAYDRHNARRRAEYAAKKQPRRDPLTAALFGSV